MPEQSKKWRFAIDRGGTFTDAVALDPNGTFHSLKLLSDSPFYKDASIEVIRKILGLASNDPIPYEKISGIRFGTTLATNALLERRGGRVALLITKGFADLLEIGYQDRPDIFTLHIKKFPPLYSAVIEVDERIDCHGRVLRKLDASNLSRKLDILKGLAVDTVAVVLMHSWKNPSHELACERILREHGFSDVVLSHKTVNLIKIVSRGQTTLIDAYLSTILRSYLEWIHTETRGVLIEFIQSNGFLSHPKAFTGKSSLFSGPAGGVRAVAQIATETGIGRVIGFDMGGTSTDVSRFEKFYERTFEKTINGIPLYTEMLNINTVASGGGSILRFDGQKMLVGPDSAGACPGPSCYGFGGPLTITDANLITGRLVVDFFPRTFGKNRNSPVHANIVHEKFAVLANQMNSALVTSFTTLDIASGFLRIANEKMAMAIKEISVSKGFDVREYTLLCFGGAGGQHACPIASILDIKKIVIHPLSSVMSAYGIGLAQPAHKAAHTILLSYNAVTHKKISSLFEEIENNMLGRKSSEKSHLTIKREIDIRPKGTEMFLTIPFSSFKETIETFDNEYKRLFGFSCKEREIEAVNLRVEIQESADFFVKYRRKSAAKKVIKPVSFQNIFYNGNSFNAPIYTRESLPAQTRIKGPGIIVDEFSTIVIDPDYEAEMSGSGLITIERAKKRIERRLNSLKKADPVLLEVFNNLFRGIATEMGNTLKNTAYSVNIKERLDFSCAIFNAEGNLVANAPHIPVHLGAMADSVKTILDDNSTSMKPGDMYLTNSPYRGGSHLPDMTVVCPVFSSKGKLLFFTASRGHHADVGGITPGSMPPFASHIDEEGVLIDDLLIVSHGRFRARTIRKILEKQKYPARNASERLFDIKAQIASCNKGKEELSMAFERYGLRLVNQYMRYIQENAAYCIKRGLSKFLGKNNSFHSGFEDYLDDGTPLRVSISIDGGNSPPETLNATLDFSGTGSQHRSDNLNAPLSVTKSAVLYVLRLLADEDIPLNSGCLEPVQIIIPEGTILNPLYPSPVASGNVETSQRIVDVLLGALGLAAASQGTMNNLLFEVKGDTPYYETIAGGSGAFSGYHGASGVQVHMTNTKITDPEILEFRHPFVRLERFTLRKNSGGKGKFCGGNGVIRELHFLKPAHVSILSERRTYAPYGLKGGKPGKKGVNIYKKTSGAKKILRHREELKVKALESIIIKTPGGGGYGKQ